MDLEGNFLFQTSKVREKPFEIQISKGQSFFPQCDRLSCNLRIL